MSTADAPSTPTRRAWYLVVVLVDSLHVPDLGDTRARSLGLVVSAPHRQLPLFALLSLAEGPLNGLGRVHTNVTHRK